MPTLEKMHQLVARSPRAQAKFFLLADDIVDIYFMGMDQSFIGRHQVQQSFHQRYREDGFASTAMPSLGGLGIAELEPMESQQRGFQHGHRKKYAIPCTREQDLIKMFQAKDSTELHGLFSELKNALIRCAETLQYESSCLPAKQMGQTVLPEKFTKKQQAHSRLDGGTELDDTARQFLAATVNELPGHQVLEQRMAAAEQRPPLSMYSQVSLKGCHQSLMPTYRLPQSIGNLNPVDELGMCSTATRAAAAAPPAWSLDGEDEHVTGLLQPTVGDHDATGGAGVAQPASLAQLMADASQWALSFTRDFRALHQLNHDHDCTSTCIKYVHKKGKENAEAALKSGRVVSCRFNFYHILEFVYYCSTLMRTITKRIRRRGKQPVAVAYIASTNEHNEFCKPVLERTTPFRSASSDVSQAFGRCNVDLQFMPRTLDPDHLLEGSAAQPTVPEVDPKLALAMYGVRI